MESLPLSDPLFKINDKQLLKLFISYADFQKGTRFAHISAPRLSQPDITEDTFQDGSIGIDPDHPHHLEMNYQTRRGGAIFSIDIKTGNVQLKNVFAFKKQYNRPYYPSLEPNIIDLRQRWADNPEATHEKFNRMVEELTDAHNRPAQMLGA